MQISCFWEKKANGKLYISRDNSEKKRKFLGVFFATKTIITSWVLGKIELYPFSPVKNKFRGVLREIVTIEKQNSDKLTVHFVKKNAI